MFNTIIEIGLLTRTRVHFYHVSRGTHRKEPWLNKRASPVTKVGNH